MKELIDFGKEKFPQLLVDGRLYVDWTVFCEKICGASGQSTSSLWRTIKKHGLHEHAIKYKNRYYFRTRFMLNYFQYVTKKTMPE